MLAQCGERWVRVVVSPDQRVPVQQRGAADEDAAQVVTVRPEDLQLLGDERGDVGGVGDHVVQRLGAEVRVRLLDPRAERRGHRVEVISMPPLSVSWRRKWLGGMTTSGACRSPFAGLLRERP
jgi:hypothetical protein